MKFKFYVAILFQGDQHRFVTSVNNTLKTAKWEAGKPAWAFTESTARNLVFGLVSNGYPAVIVKAPDAFKIENAREGEDYAD